MPSNPASITVIIRQEPGFAPRYLVDLDTLTDALRRYRELRTYMPTTREELKAMRLKTMGMVGAQRDATAGMYQRVQDAGTAVDTARGAAEAAYMAEIDAQVGDLKEMADELLQEAQSIPLNGGTAGQGQSKPSGTPAVTTKAPATASAALAALQATQPGNVNFDPKGDAYVGTHPDGTEGPK